MNDLNIFRNKVDLDQCQSNNIKQFEECDSLNRLFCALKYYTTLDVAENQNDQNIFMQFMKEIYHVFIDDYTHLVTCHDHGIESIHKYLTQNESLFDECDIKKCLFTSRHYEIDQTESNSKDLTSNFYKRNMDSLHFYLLHLFDTGLRINEMKQNKHDNEENNNYFDAKFKQINHLVKKQTKTASFDRLTNNTKFNMVITDNQGITNFCPSFESLQ